MSQATVKQDGSFKVENGVFDYESGDQTNRSSIPAALGEIRSEQLEEGRARPKSPSALAPNSVEISVSPVRVQTELDRVAPGSTLVPGSVNVTSTVELDKARGSADYAQQLTVVVYGPDGRPKSTEVISTAGDVVTVGPDGRKLPDSASTTVTYKEGDKLVVFAQNIDKDGAAPKDSGVFVVSKEGRFERITVEDMYQGGDFDLNDNLTSQTISGVGKALATRTVTTTSQAPFVEVRDEAASMVESREDARLNLSTRTFDLVEERKKLSPMKSPTPSSRLLNHASGATGAGGESLAGLSRYTGSEEVRLGEDGVSATVQTKPLAANPKAPPTLLSGTARFDPAARDGEATVTGTLGVTQYLTRTHVAATDPVTGSELRDDRGRRLLIPTGVGGDPGRLTGYVPAVPERTIPGEVLTARDGVYDLPGGKEIRIAPPTPGKEGRGNAWFTGNVGALLVERPDGSAYLTPRWTRDGADTGGVVLAPGEASRVMPVLVPEQKGQSLALGKKYEVVRGEDGRFKVKDGDAQFNVFTPVTDKENFRSTDDAHVSAVEDTKPGVVNARGLRQGEYRQKPGGPLISTKDLDDALVGARPVTPDDVIPGLPGQAPYPAPKQAVGGFLAQASLTAGVGNQERVTTTTTSSYEATGGTRDTVRSTTTTPGVNRTSTPGIESTETTTTTGEVVTFGLDGAGKLTDVKRTDDPSRPSTTVSKSSRDLTGPGATEFVATGPASTTEEVVSSERLAETVRLVGRDVRTEKDTDVGLTPVSGEASIGYVQNLGGTPWTNAANQFLVQGYANGVVLGSGVDTGEAGVRAKFVLNPFGEEKRPAYRVTADGKTEPLYETRPVKGEDGRTLTTTIRTADGREREVEVNEFVRGPDGELVQAKTGSGEARGPRAEIGVEQPFGGDLRVRGGVKINF